MELLKGRVISLVGDLWDNKYPLVAKHFGKHINVLVKALLADPPFEGEFVICAFEPENLEERLKRIELLNVTASILHEVNDTDPEELDNRLMAAWAELRTADLLLKEGFSEIQKVKATADFKAVRDARRYAIQVKRISTELVAQFCKHSDPAKKDPHPEGELTELIDRFDKPLYLFFRNAITEKNDKFQKWTEHDYTRVIVLISGDEALQDAFTRHQACIKLRDIIHSLDKRHFEEVVWLPDTGNGAWFVIGDSSLETRCFADWCDDPSISYTDRQTKVDRREVNLNSDIHRWV